MKLFRIAGIVCCIIYPQVLAAIPMSDVAYHGYFRAGMGTNNKEGDQTCFNNPGAGSNEFRIGNECDNYGEIVLKADHSGTAKQGTGSKDAGFFYSQVRLAYSQKGHSNWEDKNPVHVREIFAEGGGYDGIPLSYWAGKRFYRENDLFMNDWYYFADTSANGGGIGHIPVGIGKLHLALLKEINDSKLTDSGHTGLTLVDARVRDIKLSDSQTLMLWLAHGQSPKVRVDEEDGMTTPKQTGQAVGGLLSSSFSGGFNHLSLIYGRGLLHQFNVFGNTLLPEKTADSLAASRANRLRVVEHITMTLNKKVELSGSVYGESRDSGAVRNAKETWYGIGLQPLYKFTDHYQLIAQIGQSIVKANHSTARTMQRITIAPQISVGPSIWARPVIRAYYSYTSWNDANKGVLDADGAYANETNGSNYGLQTEIWF